MAAGDVSPKESFAPRGTTGRKDDARRTGGQAATPTEVAAQAEDSASQVPAERRRVTGKNWKATDVSYEELRWHFLQVPTIEAASRKSILLTKREEAAGAVTSSGGKKAEENDSSPEQPASLAAPSPTSASSSQKDEEELKTEAPQVEHAPRRPRGESKGRGRRGPGRGAPREQSQDPELSPVSALRESAELREKRKEMLQGGADESDSSPEKPALAAPDPTDASSKDSEPEDSLKTEEIAEEAPALLSAAPPRREAEETPSTAEPSVSAPGPAPGSAPSQKGTKTEDPLKTEALTLEIPVTPGQSWRKMHISPCKERRRRPGSTSPKSSRNACVTGTAESRTKSLGAGDDSPKNHWKGSAQQPEEEAKKPRIKELRKQNAELEALSTKDTPTPPSASPKDQIWSRLHDMHRELDERRKELVEQKRREVQEQETEIRAKCRTFRQAQTSEVEAIASKLHGHKAEMEAKRQEALKEYEKRFESIHSFAPELSPKTRELAELKAVGATQTARIAQLYKDHHRRMAQRESQKEQLEVEELRILAEHSVHKNVSVKALESSQKLFEDAQKRAERLQQKCEAVLQKELEAFQKDCIHKAVASPPEFGERLHQEAKKRGVRLQRKRKEAENAMKAAARRCKSTPALGEGPSGQGFLQLYEDAQRREKTLSERRKKQLEDEQQELQNMQWVGPQASQALARASSPVEPVEPVPPASASGSRSVSASGRGRRSRSASPRPMSPKAASAQGPLGTSTKLKSSSVQELPSPRGRPREVSRETASSSRQPSRELPSTSRQIQVRPPSPRNPQITPSTEVTKNSRPASPEASQPRDVSMGRSAASAGASSSAPARRPQGPQGSQAQKGSTQRADRAQARPASASAGSTGASARRVRPGSPGASLKSPRTLQQHPD